METQTDRGGTVRQKDRNTDRVKQAHKGKETNPD